MSLSKPHPIWTMGGYNSYEICKAIVQAKMLSGRYRTDKLLRHFSRTNDGLCQHCPEQKQIGSLEHLLINCSAFNSTRVQFFQMLIDNKSISQEAKTIIFKTFSTNTSVTQKVHLLLDCSSISTVISACQTNPNILNEMRYSSSHGHIAMGSIRGI